MLFVEIRDVKCFREDHVHVCAFNFILLLEYVFPRLCYKYVCKVCDAVALGHGLEHIMTCFMVVFHVHKLIKS